MLWNFFKELLLDVGVRKIFVRFYIRVVLYNWTHVHHLCAILIYVNPVCQKKDFDNYNIIMGFSLDSTLKVFL